MNEAEGLKEKETAGEPPQKPPKEPQIHKFYNACGLVQNIFLVTSFIVGLLYMFAPRRLATSPCIYADIHNSYTSIISNIFNWLVAAIFLINILFIIGGIVLYALNKPDETKKTYGKKFIIRGCVGLILIFIIAVAVAIFSSLIGLCVTGHPMGTPELLNN